MPPRSGYTLPVYVAAAAVAALKWLKSPEFMPTTIAINLLEPAQTVEIPVEEVAEISKNTALAITRSDPGDNLDLTRDMAIWAMVSLKVKNGSEPQITLEGGEGVGKIVDLDYQPAIYSYAQRVICENLQGYLSPEEKISVKIIFPQGRSLATCTSNSAFGVVEGLSLLGTTGISQPLSAPGQLELCLEQLRSKAAAPVVFCIGENGLDLAQKNGINPKYLVKTANWLGPMLAEAGVLKIPQVLIFGYHGKLIKLAGGIFHTHHHLADGRLEILIAYGAKVGLEISHLQQLWHSATTEEGLQYLRQIDAHNGTDWVKQVYNAIAQAIDTRSQAYIYNHSQAQVKVGSILFDRNRQILVSSPAATDLIPELC
ncbi:cobalt-precorrin-5B (C(1))-methyltransferase CbiD [Merismopedia glauca]|uniref:Cobalt-precorrin-5B C(1)-methyltransferase n=1 Tax=Merismopedia glauca CCAP 1448/3 TaxID=1296344 RepID=A0A2T1C4N4_9CYAN|nr:cobalt-precorrin-5B (C(1))-methyltransferase CbiD [Merismopedia glauca]PSB03219.1 cobalt-precorrin-5B (C(1))-methyltransferase [Merismopedia glauca CCAP 1448/3]